MKKYQLKQILISLITCSVLALLPLAAPAAEFEGVKVPDSARISEAGAELLLNGTGLRSRFMFRVYVGALYLEKSLAKKSAAAGAIINDAGAKRIALHMLRELPADQFAEALEDGLKNNTAAEELPKLEARVKQLRAVFDAVKIARAGDVIIIDFLPGTGARISINGDAKATIAGEDFSRALLRIWLGDKPADGNLKKGLLGG
ncbi:MAG: chalcone isomerase family protein [Burkholderiales bacterium]|nr:chalcone isomerase family protein [Burkholderiales bacterium]